MKRILIARFEGKFAALATVELDKSTMSNLRTVKNKLIRYGSKINGKWPKLLDFQNVVVTGNELLGSINKIKQTLTSEGFEILGRCMCISQLYETVALDEPLQKLLDQKKELEAQLAKLNQDIIDRTNWLMKNNQL